MRYRDEISTVLRAGIIEDSNNAWCSLLVQPDGSRLVRDCYGLTQSRRLLHENLGHPDKSLRLVPLESQSQPSQEELGLCRTSTSPRGLNICLDPNA